MDQLARELFAYDRVASAVVTGVSVHVGDRWVTDVGAAGRLARGTNEPSVSTETWFDLASLTKPVTALAAARLVRAGKLDLRTSLESLVQEVVGTASEGVPLELLLAHRAGLEAHLPLFRHLTRGRLASRREALIEAASARRRDAQGPIPSEGFAPRYSDLGYLLAGEAIARRAGNDLDAVIEALVTRPLGAAIGSARQIRARDASFPRRVAATEFVSWRGGTLRGVVHDENAWAHSGEGVSGHAGLFGTVGGVLVLGRTVVDVLHGRSGWFLTREELWPLVKPRPGGTLRAGFDSKNEHGSSAGAKFGPSTIGHLGFTGTSLWCDIERQMVGVLLTNSVHPCRESEAIRRVRPRAYDCMADQAAALASR
ncbi:MAG TPA: serine hydrolase domain-containing protein [Polyangiaceae bacterium]